jgi:hypothetical protein
MTWSTWGAMRAARIPEPQPRSATVQFGRDETQQRRVVERVAVELGAQAIPRAGGAREEREGFLGAARLELIEAELVLLRGRPLFGLILGDVPEFRATVSSGVGMR